MYGFHVGWRFFLKIYMLNPSYMQRLGDLLRNGSIMGKPMQPYEIHIPYLLQFMADFGLYGCGWVECETISFRAPVPDNEDDERMWAISTIPKDLISTSEDRPRLSHCTLEVDLLSHHILNRQSIKPRLLHHDFVERQNPPSPNEKLVHSMAELWLDEERRHKKFGKWQPVPSVYSSLSQNDAEIKRNGPWIHETELRAKLEETIQIERARSDAHALSFDTFIRPLKFQSLVQTALESVTDMFPIDIPSQKEAYVGMVASSGHVRDNSNEFPSGDVDEAQILALLKDIDAATDNPEVSWREEYFSELSSEVASDVDFDRDLLGRGQNQGESDVEEDAFPYVDVQDFSDDSEIDFEIGSKGVKLEKEKIVDSDGDPPFKPLRLRGGASSPERKKRRKNEPFAQEKKPKTSDPASEKDSPQNIRFEDSTSMLVNRVDERSLIDNSVVMMDDSTIKVSQMIWSIPPPSTADVPTKLRRCGIPRVVPQNVFYSRDEDVPSTTREYGGREFKLVSRSLPYLDHFNTGISTDLFKYADDNGTKRRIWQLENRPPAVQSLEKSEGLGFRSGNKPHFHF
jgi:DNA polymerase zeta